jgi:hypothetical protein
VSEYSSNPAPAAAPDQWIVRIGDIGVSRNFLSTPAGVTGLRGTTFSVVDRTSVTSKTPTWAIVVAIAGFFVIFLFSLLFLLVKETAPTGHLELTVSNPETGVTHTTILGIRGGGDIADAYARINQAQQLAATAAPTA